VTTRFYGLLWRWHFLAGAAAFPILFVVAVTGALYAFQPELDRWASSELWTARPPDPEARRRPLDELVHVAARACKPASIYVPRARDRAVTASCEGGGRREVFIDPYRAELLGERDAAATFFGVVFSLHWELLLGEPGRLAIEWATSWAILLMAFGAALWWPRGKRRGGGVWWPRRGLAARQRLRDIHAVLGAYALPVLFAIAATGLMWTLRAGGERWHPLTEDAFHDAWDRPPRSTVIVGRPRIGLSAAAAAAGIAPDRERRAIYTTPPARPDDPYVFYLYDDTHATPSAEHTVWIDAYSGARLLALGWPDRSAAGKLDSAKYAIHVGALLGWPGRLLACAAALVLAALCATGPWMWWKRRPRGELGVPPRTRRAPWPLLAVLAGVGWLLPMIGWTLIALVAIELGARLVRRRRGPPPIERISGRP
jgi:uncharacterized iron-regulated membrane protein